MRKFYYYLLYTIYIILIIPSYSLTQWVHLNGPYGGNIVCLTANGNKVFAGSENSGIYLSTDNGDSWVQKNNGLSDMRIVYLCSSNSNIFAATPYNVFISSDNGNSWLSADNGLPYYIQIIVSSGNKIYAVNRTDLFLSSNNGELWTKKNISIPNIGYIHSIAVKDSLILVGTSISLYRSTNYGESWTKLNLDNDIRAIRCRGALIIAGTSSNGIFFSTNNGADWTQTDNCDDIKYSTTDENTIHTQTESCVISSSNSGLLTSHLSKRFSIVNSIIASGSKIFAATGPASGIYRTTDEGENWMQVNNGINATALKDLVSLGDTIYAGVLFNGLFFSSDDGLTWTQISKGLSDNHYSSLGVKGNNLFAGAWAFTEDSAKIFLSTDHGAEWVNISNGIHQEAVITCFAFKENKIFAGTYETDGHREWGYVYLSTNEGASWNTLLSNGFPNCIQTLFINNNYIYAGTYWGYALRSRIDSINWNYIYDLEMGSNIPSFCAIGNTIVAHTDYYGVCRSTDDGNTWQKSVANIDAQIFTKYKNNIFAGGYNRIYLSSDTGSSWQRVDDGFSGLSVVCLTIKGEYIYAATYGQGIWRRLLSEIFSTVGLSSLTATRENNCCSSPKAFSLSQNYPNPFNPSTVIKYSIPIESNVIIKFYNALGQVVRKAYEGLKQPGNYELSFNSSGLSSGIYFYSIQAASTNGKKDFSAVKKMIIMK